MVIDCIIYILLLKIMSGLIAFSWYTEDNNTNLTLIMIMSSAFAPLAETQIRVLLIIPFRSSDAKHYLLYSLHVVLNDFSISMFLGQEKKLYSCNCLYGKKKKSLNQ